MKANADNESHADIEYYRLNKICYVPAWRSVLGKTVPEVSSAAFRPWAIFETESTVFPNTDRPMPANNVFIFSTGLLCKGLKCPLLDRTDVNEKGAHGLK